MESAATQRLGDLFVERGLITDEQLGEALRIQGETGAKLGEILVEQGFITRIALAGVIAEQWDALGVTAGGRKSAQAQARAASASAGGGSIVEAALRERLEAVTAELTALGARVAQQDATIAALMAQLGAQAATGS